MVHVCLTAMIWACGVLQDPTVNVQELQDQLMKDLHGSSEFIAQRLSASWANNSADRIAPVNPLFNLPAPPIPVPTIGVASVAELTHKVPKPARQAYDRAAKFSQKGQYLEASLELELAVTLDPDYANAHNNLGVQYFMLHRLEDADREYRRAVELNPALADAHTNMATAALFGGDLYRADTEARKALALAPSDEQARSVLAAVRDRAGR